MSASDSAQADLGIAMQQIFGSGPKTAGQSVCQNPDVRGDEPGSTDWPRSNPAVALSGPWRKPSFSMQTRAPSQVRMTHRTCSSATLLLRIIWKSAPLDRTLLSISGPLAVPPVTGITLHIPATIVAALKGTRPLVKDDKGVWSITVGPLDPAIYSYGFAVDGAIRIPDPANPNVEERRWGHTSYVEVPGDPNTPRDYRPVPHGTIHEHAYDSKSLNAPRAFVVYTPPGYETSKGKYPVLYLLHGSTQTEESWSRVGGAQIILDNLLADGKALPMVVVMPYGHVGRQMIPAAAGQGRGARGGSPGGEAAGFEKDLLAEVIPLVDQKYRVLTGTANRAIVGLSMGGGEAMLTGLHHPEMFGYIAAFSGVTNYRADMGKRLGPRSTE